MYVIDYKQNAFLEKTAMNIENMMLWLSNIYKWIKLQH